MLQVVVDGVLDAKVIDDKAEYYREVFVFEEASCLFQLVISVLGEVRYKLVISKSAGLWDPIHAFTYLYVDMAVVYEVG